MTRRAQSLTSASILACAFDGAFAVCPLDFAPQSKEIDTWRINNQPDPFLPTSIMFSWKVLGNEWLSNGYKADHAIQYS